MLHCNKQLRENPILLFMMTDWRWPTFRSDPPRLSLALQGGGAHGAFTWGVLDALLADPRCNFDGISGSSAGAMNAVVMADGWCKGGRDGARQGLTDFWAMVGQQIPASLMAKNGGDALSPAGKLMATWAGCFSPSQLNPLRFDPLREWLLRHVDFERLRAASPFKLFIAATNARSGRLRLFREHELSLDMLLASACLPTIHHAVQIDGEPYWDGGYSANPAVFPLFYDCESRDVLLVLLSPLQRPDTPTTVGEIGSRAVELAFSTNFMREMRTFAQATAFAKANGIGAGLLESRLMAMRFHMVDTSDLASLQRTDTKLLAHGPFLVKLCAQGRERGQAWLDTHRHAVGRRSSIDLEACFA